MRIIFSFLFFYFIINSIVIFIFAVTTYFANKIFTSSEDRLRNQNEFLNNVILEKDKENKMLLDSIVLLRVKRDSIVYRIDTIIKYKNEEINNLDNVDADSILRIITNYLPD